jgi:hypothetical protein
MGYNVIMSNLFPVDDLVNDIKVSLDYRMNQFLRNYESQMTRYKEQERIIESFPSVRKLREEISALETKLWRSENDKKTLHESLSRSQSVSSDISPRHTQDVNDEVSKLTKERNIVRGKLYLMEQENKTLRMQLEAERLKTERKQAIERQRICEIEADNESESDEEPVELTMASQVSGFSSEVVVTKKDDTKEVVKEEDNKEELVSTIDKDDLSHTESEPKVHLDIQELDDLNESDAEPEPVSEDDVYITDEAEPEDEVEAEESEESEESEDGAEDEADNEVEAEPEDEAEDEVEAEDEAEDEAEADNEVEAEPEDEAEDEAEDEPKAEPEDEAEQNKSQTESDEEEMYETEIQGKTYITNDPDEQNGVIYDCVVDSDGDFGVGDEVGQFVNGKAEFFT